MAPVRFECVVVVVVVVCRRAAAKVSSVYESFISVLSKYIIEKISHMQSKCENAIKSVACQMSNGFNNVS